MKVSLFILKLIILKFSLSERITDNEFKCLSLCLPNLLYESYFCMGNLFGGCSVVQLFQLLFFGFWK